MTNYNFISSYKIVLIPNGGLPSYLVFTFAVISAFMAANIYYNQPLLDVIHQEMGVSQVCANFVTVVAQIGYALGLLFIIPLGDMISRRQLVIGCTLLALVMSLVMAVGNQISILWLASFFIGISSIVPQIFMPIAGLYSTPATKGQNMGYILTGLLTGILVSRVLGGLVGEYFGWRMMYHINILIMALCLVAILRLLPVTPPNFTGNYIQLMKSVASIFLHYPSIRYYSMRAGLAFVSMLCVWSCMAFHLSGAPFHASSKAVGLLGLCGVAGALASMNIGKFIPRFGISKFSIVGALMQLISWLFIGVFGNSYYGLITGIILLDIGLQCQQLSNQNACLSEIPKASSRVNTIFMTIYFIFGALGTMISSFGWTALGWTGVSVIGACFALSSLIISLRLSNK